MTTTTDPGPLNPCPFCDYLNPCGDLAISYIPTKKPKECNCPCHWRARKAEKENTVKNELREIAQDIKSKYGIKINIDDLDESKRLVIGLVSKLNRKIYELDDKINETTESREELRAHYDRILTLSGIYPPL